VRKKELSAKRPQEDDDELQPNFGETRKQLMINRASEMLKIP
jgi:hypothetical protein